MIVAIVGSQGLDVNIEDYIPKEMSRLISGGAKGIDTLAEEYADKRRIPKLILKPFYEVYGNAAPLIRNRAIVETADMIVAIWDGKSKGTKSIIQYAEKLKKPLKVILIE